MEIEVKMCKKKIMRMPKNCIVKWGKTTNHRKSRRTRSWMFENINIWLFEASLLSAFFHIALYSKHNWTTTKLHQNTFYSFCSFIFIRKVNKNMRVFWKSIKLWLQIRLKANIKDKATWKFLYTLKMLKTTTT